jgi:hypothetical protein
VKVIGFCSKQGSRTPSYLNYCGSWLLEKQRNDLGNDSQKDADLGLQLVSDQVSDSWKNGSAHSRWRVFLVGAPLVARIFRTDSELDYEPSWPGIEETVRGIPLRGRTWTDQCFFRSMFLGHVTFRQEPHVTYILG